MILQCGINLNSLNLSCGICHTCNAKSKGAYSFNSDLSKSQELVEALMALVAETTSFHCIPPGHVKDPDIQVLDSQERLVCRIEAKMLEDKPFMKVNSFLSGHDLQPKETIVVDYSKLMSYFERMQADNCGASSYIPTFVVWHLGRPCAELNGITVFQECQGLKTIFNQKGKSRVYDRKTGTGDFKDGTQMGITKKYHFSVRECRPIEELVGELQTLERT